MKQLDVFLSPLASFKLERLFNYIEGEWGTRSKDKFKMKFVQSIERISTHPGSCKRVEAFPDLRRCVITKQTSFFYRVIEDEIEIVTVVDNRQNPEKIWKEIEEQFPSDLDSL